MSFVLDGGVIGEAVCHCLFVRLGGFGLVGAAGVLGLKI
jgi:hypothetical protein